MNEIININGDEKRILRIVTRLNVGGVTKHLGILSREMSVLNWNTLIVHGALESNEIDMSFFIDKNKIKRQMVASMKRGFNPINDFISVYKIYKIIRSYKPHIVETHTSKAGILGRLSVFISNLFNNDNVKAVHIMHGNVFNGYFNKFISKLIIFTEKFFACFLTDAVITISNQQQYEIDNYYKIIGKKGNFQINLAFDPAFASSLERSELRNRFNIKITDIIIGVVGRITKIKNIELFIQSSNIFIDKYKNKDKDKDKDIYFLIIGDGDNDYIDELKKIIAPYNNNIIFTGNINEQEIIYGALDCLVNCSLNEGTPVSILEAFASKVPVISGSAGGIVDLIGANERGLILDVIQPQNFSNAYYQLFDKKLKLKISNAFSYVINNYSVENISLSYNSLYQNLLENYK